MGINISANTRSFKLTDVFNITLNDEKLVSTAYTKVGTCWSDYSEITVGTYHHKKGDNILILVTINHLLIGKHLILNH